MADRILVEREEERLWNGPHHKISVERAASGTPGLFFTVSYESYDGTLPAQQLTTFVADGDKFLEPILAWMSGVELPVELTIQQVELMRNAWWAEENRLRHLAEKWEGQTSRDLSQRDRAIREAILSGVPKKQVEKFVFDGHDFDYEAVSGNPTPSEKRK